MKDQLSIVEKRAISSSNLQNRINFYKKEKFVNIVNSKEMINTNRVLNTNNCNISVYQTRFDNQIIIASSLDNLIKGAAGQAVQNFNIRFGFKETLSLV